MCTLRTLHPTPEIKYVIVIFLASVCNLQLLVHNARVYQKIGMQFCVHSEFRLGLY